MDVRPQPPLAGEPIGIVAGGGILPHILAEAARGAGWHPVIIAVGEGAATDWTGFEAHAFGWNRVGDAVAFLKSRGVRRLVVGGTIAVRPDFRSLVPSLRTLALVPELLRMIRGGDDHLLRAAIGALERRGFEFLAVQDVAPELLMPAGLLAGHRPSRSEMQALQRGSRAALRLGELDIGQAVVASQDRVIAAEGIEGTRDMLLRVADYRRRGRIGKGERLVLVKAVKPGQDRRIDLPSIGAGTIEEGAKAGLAGIGLSAGGGLIIGLEDVIAAAQRNGVFVIGLDAGDEPVP